MNAWVWFVVGVLGIVACGAVTEARADEETVWSERRARMVEQLRRYGVRDEGVLSVMASVPRHRYIPEHLWRGCDPYGDHPCPIGYGQTISQPFIVAYMTAHMQIQAGERVLEIGTGSGYQAAILAALGAEVYSVEIVPELAAHAERQLAAVGGPPVHVRAGDGYQGWPEYAPFDVVMVTCAPDQVPQALVDQLKEGGRMIVPVGEQSQRLVILRKQDGKVSIQEDLPVRFVPMVHPSPVGN